ncbi:unnamed protein product, partial [Allacma fusca]
MLHKLIHVIFSRLVGIVFCSQVISLVQKIEAVKSYNGKHGVVTNSRRHLVDKSKFYVPLAVVSILNASTVIALLVSDDPLDGQSNSIFPSTENWMVKLPQCLLHLNTCFCKMITSGLVICFGVNLLAAWKDLFDIFQTQFCWQKMIVKTIEPNVKGQDDFAVEFSDAFHQIQDCL